MTYTTIQEIRRNCKLLSLKKNSDGNGATSMYLDEKNNIKYTVVGHYYKDGSFKNNISYA